MSSEMTRMMPTACGAVTVATASNTRNRWSSLAEESSVNPLDAGYGGQQVAQAVTEQVEPQRRDEDGRPRQ